jgi:hypothetical protein
LWLKPDEITSAAIRTLRANIVVAGTLIPHYLNADHTWHLGSSETLSPISPEETVYISENIGLVHSSDSGIKQMLNFYSEGNSSRTRYLNDESDFPSLQITEDEALYTFAEGEILYRAFGEHYTLDKNIRDRNSEEYVSLVEMDAGQIINALGSSTSLHGLNGREVLELKIAGDVRMEGVVIYVSYQIEGLPFFEHKELDGSMILEMQTDGEPYPSNFDEEIVTNSRKLTGCITAQVRSPLEYEYLRFLYDLQIQLSISNEGFGMSEWVETVGSNGAWVLVENYFTVEDAYWNYYAMYDKLDLFDETIEGKRVGDMSIQEAWGYMLFTTVDYEDGLRAIRLMDMATENWPVINGLEFRSYVEYYAYNFLLPISALEELRYYNNYREQDGSMAVIEVNNGLPSYDGDDNRELHFIPMGTDLGTDDGDIIKGLLPEDSFDEFTGDNSALIMTYSQKSMSLIGWTIEGMITAYTTDGGLKGWFYSTAQVPIIIGSFQIMQFYMPIWATVSTWYEEANDD